MASQAGIKPARHKKATTSFTVPSESTEKTPPRVPSPEDFSCGRLIVRIRPAGIGKPVSAAPKATMLDVCDHVMIPNITFGIDPTCSGLPEFPFMEEYRETQAAAGGILYLWLLIELCFYLSVKYYIFPRVNALRQPPQNPLSPTTSMLKVLSTVNRLSDSYSFEKFFRGWFKDASMEEIKEGNVKEFLAWVTYHRHFNDLKKEEHDAVQRVVDLMDKTYSVKFEPGYNPDCEFVCMNLEPLEYIHRLLIFYVIVKIVQIIGGIYLHALGYRRYHEGGVSYWYRPWHEDDIPNYNSPLIFFHGITPGLCVYLPFLQNFARNRHSILVEIPHITTNLHFEATSHDIIVKAVERIYQKHNFRDIVVAGHSFGTICAKNVAAAYPDRVKQLILIDPVCLLLFLPDVAYNFLYRTPNTRFGRFLKACFGISREITINNALRRHFFWYLNILWIEDVKCSMVVALSENDGIVPVEAISNYVTGHQGKSGEKAMDTRLVMWPNMGHGQMLLNTSAQEELFETIRDQAIISEMGLKTPRYF